MPRFYINYMLNLGEEIALPGSIVQHLNVLRLKCNTIITLFNGDGFSYSANIISLEKKHSIVSIIHKNAAIYSNDINLNLAISIIANDKMDLAIRAATELNVTKITPIISNYSQRISNERLENRMEHWYKVIQSACEQCGQNKIPEILRPVSFNNFISNSSSALIEDGPFYKTVENPDMLAKLQLESTDAKGKFILSISQNENTVTAVTLKKFKNITLLVGPEGGFTSAEVDLAISSGYIAIRPWNNILRAETAVTAGISLILNNLH